MNIAIVGAGVSGLAAARALAPRHQVTIYEAAARAGGHVHTVDVDGPSGPVAVDLGFIVCNRETYPRFFAMLDELGVATRATSMSFAVDGWATDRLRDPRFSLAVAQFLRRVRQHEPGELSLDEYLQRLRTADEVRDRFARPLAAALWSIDRGHAGDFPAATFRGFLAQHGMLRAFGNFTWRTIVGGARRYVDALLARLPVRLWTDTAVTRVHRDATIESARGVHRHDAAIVATHADTALALLAEPTDDERRVLGAFRYARHRVVLHGDPRVLPEPYASWNVHGGSITYSMNRLQGLEGARYLVSLDPPEVRGVLAETEMTHPRFDLAALRAQRELTRLGDARVRFAGAHFGFGFHEDGMRAGERAAAAVSS